MPRTELDLSVVAFSSAEVSEMAHISLRQLQWWDEQDVLSPNREDRRRRLYRAKDAVGVMVIAELRRKGFSLQKVRRLIERFIRREIGKREREILTGHSGLYLLTDGKAISFEVRPDRIIDVFKKSTQPMCLISVDDLVKTVAEFYVRAGSNRTINQLDLF